jgi:hypothetical protein
MALTVTEQLRLPKGAIAAASFASSADLEPPPLQQSVGYK